MAKMRNILALAAVLVFARVCGAEVMLMDAAELDANGAALEWPCVLAIYDNRLGETDATDVSFAVEVTGSSGFSDIPAVDPWADTYPKRGTEIIGTRKWWYATELAPDQRLRPALSYLILPGDPEYKPYDPDSGWDQEYWDYVYHWVELGPGVLPAGMMWYKVVEFVGGEPGAVVKLFNSPAQGDFTDQDGTHVVIDADPMPQLAPEPGTATLLVLSAAALAARRKRE